MRTLLAMLLLVGAQAAFADAPLGRTVENWDSNGKPQHIFTWYRSGNRNIKHGWEVYYYEDGQMARKYAWLKGQLNGPYQSWHPDGSVKEQGTYKAHKLDGAWLSQFADGKPARRCTYVNGQVEGELQEWYANGQLGRKGTWKDGKPDGAFEQYQADGKPVLSAQYAGGVMHGATTRYSPEGKKVLMLTYDHGVLDGPVRRWDAKGNILSDGMYRKGEPWDGVCWEAGDEESHYFLYTYKEGELLDAVYYDAEGPFTGMVSEWHPDRIKARECDYIAGRKEGHERWFYADGKPAAACVWKANKLAGVLEEWYRTGQKKSERNLEDGKLNGLAVEWSIRGVEMGRGVYRDDAPWDGTLLITPEDGSEPFLQVYKDGRPQDIHGGGKAPAARKQPMGPRAAPDAGLPDAAAQPEQAAPAGNE